MDLVVNTYSIFFVIASLVLGLMPKDMKTIITFGFFFFVGLFLFWYYHLFGSFYVGILFLGTLLFFMFGFFGKASVKNKDVITLETIKGKTIELAKYMVGIIILGGAGSGKTSAIVRHLIKQFIGKGFGVILYDYKGDISPLAKRLSIEADRENDFVCVDFVEPQKSVQINPIDPKYLVSEEVILTISKNFFSTMKDDIKLDFWEMGGYKVFAGVINTTKVLYPEYCTLPHVISIFLDFSEEEFYEYVCRDIVSKDWIASIEKEEGNERAVSSIRLTVKNFLTEICTPTFFWILSGKTDITVNGEQPKIVSFRTGKSVLEKANPLIAVCMSILLDQIMLGNKQKCALVMDEAHTFKFPKFYIIPSTYREYGLCTVVSSQDASQFEIIYSKAETSSLISNLGNQFFLRTSEPNAVRILMDHFGKVITKKKSKSYSKGDRGGSRGKSETTQKEYKYESSFFKDLNDAEAVGFIAGQKGNFHHTFKQTFSENEPLPKDENITADFLKLNYQKIKNQVARLKPKGKENTNESKGENNTSNQSGFSK